MRNAARSQNRMSTTATINIRVKPTPKRISCRDTHVSVEPPEIEYNVANPIKAVMTTSSTRPQFSCQIR